MSVRVEARDGEPFQELLRRFRKRVELSRRVKPGKLPRAPYRKPGDAARQQEWARQGNAMLSSHLGERSAHGLPLPVVGEWWREGRLH